MLEHRTSVAREHLAALAVAHEETDGLVLLPDTVELIGGELVAGFRPDAQGLRVAALRNGVPVTMALPADAKPGQYSEHAADWVLPVILSVPSPVVATLIANYLQQRLDSWRASGNTRLPTVRYRELNKSGDGSVQVREIEGPSDEILAWLRDERGARPSLEAADGDK